MENQSGQPEGLEYCNLKFHLANVSNVRSQGRILEFLEKGLYGITGMGAVPTIGWGFFYLSTCISTGNIFNSGLDLLNWRLDCSVSQYIGAAPL